MNLGLFEKSASPSHWISELEAAAKTEDRKEALRALRALTPAIKAYANRSDFVVRFGDKNGIDLMVRLLSFGIEDGADDELRIAFLESIKAILDSRGDDGYHLISAHSLSMTAMVEMVCLDSVADEVVTLSIKMLSALCWWSRTAYDAVLVALSHFAAQRQQSTFWPFLLRIVDTRKSEEVQFRGVQLINAITNTPWLGLEDRVFIRNDLSALGFDAILESKQMAVGNDALSEQIEVYSITKQQDDHQKVINDIDLSDPEAIWQIIKQNAIKSAVVDDLTRILQVRFGDLHTLSLSLCLQVIDWLLSEKALCGLGLKPF